MAGIVDKLQDVLTAVARRAELETRSSGAAKDLRDELRRLEDRVSDLHRQIAVLEARFTSLRGEIATEARAAAQSAAALAVGEQLAQLRERLVLVEHAQPRIALPPPV